LFDLSSSDMIEIQRWLDKMVRNVIKQELNKMGIPRLLIPGVVQSVYKNGNNTYANVYLNGSSTASSNIPVNPDIASNVTANTPVWVMAVNFDQRDLYVLARKLA
jgi:hypothetical protein